MVRAIAVSAVGTVRGRGFRAWGCTSAVSGCRRRGPVAPTEYGSPAGSAAQRSGLALPNKRGPRTRFPADRGTKGLVAVTGQPGAFMAAWGRAGVGSDGAGSRPRRHGVIFLAASTSATGRHATVRWLLRQFGHPDRRGGLRDSRWQLPFDRTLRAAFRTGTCQACLLRGAKRGRHLGSASPRAGRLRGGERARRGIAPLPPGRGGEQSIGGSRLR
jgi:hypothetical protein